MMSVYLCYTIMAKEWNFELGRLPRQLASRSEKDRGKPFQSAALSSGTDKGAVANYMIFAWSLASKS